jgi:rhodanese-related sulfurtransferase
MQNNKLPNLQLSANEVFNLMQNKNNTVFIIDVRAKIEFDNYHIENAINIHISEVNLQNVLEKLNLKHTSSAIIITYCNSGGRGGRAFKLLNDQLQEYIDSGANSNIQVANLEHGINEYINANLSGILYNK